MAKIQGLTNHTTTIVSVPSLSITRRGSPWSIPLGEPDRTGMLIAISFVLVTLIAMTVALGFAVLFS